ncbi:MAG: hypothetical protein CVT95_11490 [Bacteroidetes bacterium HGW-Bacteroidetes-12]|nr:MAG: hypothetical protein CVT95_11490 [Bacteroidetes bacterium HGW-Bacteroidetes-12]
MKKITKILLIGFLILNYSCKNDDSNKELKNHFTENEIEDLKLVTAFFKEQICQNKTKSDFKKCFEEILPELVNNGWQPILERVDFDLQKKLYDKISKSTFDKIWGFSKSRKYPEKTEYKSIEVGTSGEYIDYLKEFGIKNEFIKEYTNGILSRGGIDGMGSLQNHIYQNPKDLDLTDFNIQIIISIHYLTQNDNEKRNEKWN